MANARHRAMAGFSLLVWIAGTGCTTLREVPRSEYATAGEEHSIRILTADSLEYEFDYAKVSGDTLTGYRRQETTPDQPEYATLSLPLNDIQKVATRRVDWTRTGLIGGLGVLLVASVGLAAKNGGFGSEHQSNGNSGRPIP
jgi:hypothetical protein